MGLLYPEKIDPEEAEKLISSMVDWIRSVCDPVSIILFGSAARGEMTEASDIDLCLIFADENLLASGREAVYNSINGENSVWPKDLLFYTMESFAARQKIGGIAELIASEGRALYGSLQ